MNTWVLLITERFARLLSLVFLIGTMIYILRLKKSDFRRHLTSDFFIIGLSFLALYTFFDIIVKNLLMSDRLSLLRDIALLLSGMTFVFLFYAYPDFFLEKRPSKGKVKKHG